MKNPNRYKIDNSIPFTHYKNIVNSYKRIDKVEVNDNIVTVTGKIFKIVQRNEYTYKHSEAARANADIVRMFIGIN